jgi:cytochrome c oxidase subunit IV
MTTHTETAHTHAHAHNGHETHRPLYLKIFAALMVLLVLTVWAATFNMGQMNIVVALAIAIVKSALILLYFMHFRDSDHLTWLVGAATVAFFLILIFMTFQDYVSRDWITTMPGK